MTITLDDMLMLYEDLKLHPNNPVLGDRGPPVAADNWSKWTVSLAVPSALFSYSTPVLDGRVIVSDERRLFPASPCLST